MAATRLAPAPPEAAAPALKGAGERLPGSPVRHGRRSESAASRSPTSWDDGLLSPSLPLRPGPRSRREEESLELVPAARTLCLRPVGSAPPRREAASANRELQPPNKARSRRGRCSLLAPPGVGWLPPILAKLRALGPRSDSASQTPTCLGGASSSHFSPRPRFPFQRGRSLRPHETLSHGPAVCQPKVSGQNS